MSGTDKIKLWLAAFLVIVAVYIAGYADITAAARFAATTVALAAAAALVVFSQSGKNFSGFVRDSGSELRKVVWPNKQEVLQMTGVVMVFLSLVTMFLWLVDFIVSFLLGKLIG